MKIIMTKGLPASGKSTWARKHVTDYPNWDRVNKDDLRSMMHESKWTKANEKAVLRVRDSLVRQSLENNRNVIVDDTNFHKSHENKLREIAREFNAIFEVRYFEVTVEEAIRRDSLRDNSVGSKVIRKMYNAYIKEPIKEITYRDELPFTIISDLDGTIALIGDRSPYDGKSCGVDIPNNAVIETLQRFDQDHTLIIFSGRNGESEPETREWLQKHNVPFDYLYMRGIGDNRKDSIVKEEFYNEYVKDQFNVRFVLDDRLQVARLWYRLGLTLFRVGDPDADF